MYRRTLTPTSEKTSWTKRKPKRLRPVFLLQHTLARRRNPPLTVENTHTFKEEKPTPSLSINTHTLKEEKPTHSLSRNPHLYWVETHTFTVEKPTTSLSRHPHLHCREIPHANTTLRYQCPCLMKNSFSSANSTRNLSAGCTEKQPAVRSHSTEMPPLIAVTPLISIRNQHCRHKTAAVQLSTQTIQCVGVPPCKQPSYRTQKTPPTNKPKNAET